MPAEAGAAVSQAGGGRTALSARVQMRESSTGADTHLPRLPLLAGQNNLAPSPPGDRGVNARTGQADHDTEDKPGDGVDRVVKSAVDRGNGDAEDDDTQRVGEPPRKSKGHDRHRTAPATWDEGKAVPRAPLPSSIAWTSRGKNACSGRAGCGKVYHGPCTGKKMNTR